MRQIIDYFLIQWKRIIKSVPMILAVTLFLLVAVALAGGMFVEMDNSTEEKHKFQIGVVGDMTDSYLGFGISAIQNLDTSKYEMELIPLSLEEAKAQINNGAISCYIVIPDGFIDSIERGENYPIQYVTSSGAMDLGVIVLGDVMNTVSCLLTDTQTGIYAMQIFAIENGVATDLGTKIMDMNFVYIDRFLGRMSTFDLQQIGALNHMSVIGYYVASLTVLFLLLWGINCSSLYIRREMSMNKVLASRGLSVLKQVFIEYGSYLLLMIAFMLLIAGGVQIGTQLFDVTLPEWERAWGLPVLEWMLRLIPVMLVISSLQFLCFEVVSNIVSGVLLQFFVGMGLAFASGCLYPVSFFPKGMQVFAGMLPTGVALQYADSAMLGYLDGIRLVALLLYAMLFVAGIVLVRSMRIKNE